MTTVHIDLETFSEVDIKKQGVYKYVAHPSFEIILVAYAFDDDPVEVVDILSGERMPKKLIKAMADRGVSLHAFNANFERVALGKFYETNNWKCVQAQALNFGLPSSLAGVGEALKLPVQKMKEGNALIKYFCCPCTQTIINGGRVRNLPYHAPNKWDLFKAYNRMDVEVERLIAKRIPPLSALEQKVYELDQKINDKGIMVDIPFVEKAIKCGMLNTERLMNEMRTITRLSNPNSLKQLAEWLESRGLEIASLDKDSVEESITYIRKNGGDAEVLRVLEIRQEVAKTATKKYQPMLNYAGCGDRVRGMFKYYGANKTGRWAATGINLQNLKKISFKDILLARDIVNSGEYERIEVLYDSTTDVLSQLVRTTITSKKEVLTVVDFSAIEARVCAWLSNEQWVLDVFTGDGKIYEAAASRMYHIPIHHVNKEQRQKGKVASLACIAENELVLTDKGLVPIQRVTTKHKVWDGEEWVTHEGVIYKGVKEVITYGGLTATADHKVYTQETDREIRFDECAASGKHNLQSGDGRKAIRISKNNTTRNEVHESKASDGDGAMPMHKMWKSELDEQKQPNAREIIRMLQLRDRTEKNTNVAGSQVHLSKTKVCKRERQKLQKLRCKGYRISIPFCDSYGSMGNRKLRIEHKEYGNRQGEQRWALRSWEFEMGDKETKFRKQKSSILSSLLRRKGMVLFEKRGAEVYKTRADERTNNGERKTSSGGKEEKLERHYAKTYDIVNAGRNNRFTVSNVLVHNCQYGGGVGALLAMGAIKMGLREEELQPIVDSWRSANPNIVKFWYAVERAAKKAIRINTVVECGKIKFVKGVGVLYMILPNGGRLAYFRPSLDEQGNICHWAINQYTRKYEKQRTYSGKLVENMCQRISRDLLVSAMLETDARGFDIVAHVHDEIILDGDCFDEVRKIMITVPKWAEGLPLGADGGVSKYYVK